MTKKTQKLITVTSVLFLILCSGFFVWQEVYVPKTPNSTESKIFSVVKGEGTKEISANLREQGFIKSATAFRLYTMTFGIAGKLQAGNYLLSPSMSMPEIAGKFASGDVVKETITIIEGWNLRDISFYLEEKGIAYGADFFVAADPFEDKSEDFDFLKSKPEGMSLEGFLFPDTYLIIKGETSQEIINKILKNFGQKLTPELREEIENQDKTIFEIITMASLIEKEVRTLEDKKLVSGILWKRLESKMPLQVDATISYITQKKTTRISIEETKIDSPYNTYKYQGLPVGPISNPGLDSIVAALNPEGSQYWYYLSTPEGETIWSRTLEEHNEARAKYLK